MIIRSEHDWPNVFSRLEQARRVAFDPFPKNGVEVIWREAKRDRSLEQNNLSHAWYSQVSIMEKEYTPEQVKRFCKFHIGLPILRGDDPEFNEWCVKVIDPLPYESRIAAMEHIDVTSLMGTRQMSRYLEDVQRHYAGRVPLEFPDEK